jgi:hypothetical protein
VFYYCAHFNLTLSFLHLLECVWATSTPTPQSPGRTYSTLLFSDFCWRKKIKEKREVLLAWDKDNYIRRVLALLLCTCVIQPKMVHLYQTSSLLPSPLEIVASDSLRLLYSLFYSKHINHIQGFGFLPFSIPPMCGLPLVCYPCNDFYYKLWFVQGLVMPKCSFLQNVGNECTQNSKDTIWSFDWVFERIPSAYPFILLQSWGGYIDWFWVKFKSLKTLGSEEQLLVIMGAAKIRAVWRKPGKRFCHGFL